MKRLTTNKDVSEMNMLELAYNSCYAKDRKERYRDFENDLDARELTRILMKKYLDENVPENDDDFDEYILDDLQYGAYSTAGLIALFYRNLWVMADLRERLKMYEDAEENGRIVRLPCKVGDTIYLDSRTIPTRNMDFETVEDVPPHFKARVVSFSAKFKREIY